jgi:hypothetical protein
MNDEQRIRLRVGGQFQPGKNRYFGRPWGLTLG